MFGLGVPEILIIAEIILLIFGAKRIPEIGSGIGQTIKEIRGIKKELKGSEESTPKADEKTEASEGSQPQEKSLEGRVVDSLQKKVTDKVISQIPGIKQAKQIKDKADKIKKFVS